MKRCKHITGWTDYPFTELGDADGKVAPVRRINVIEYDGDKYADIFVLGTGLLTSIKCGYIYSQPGRYGQVKVMDRRKLERMLIG